MAKINHLDMGAEVLALDDVQVKKGFMGLTIKLIYKPTNSAIKIRRRNILLRMARSSSTSLTLPLAR